MNSIFRPVRHALDFLLLLAMALLGVAYVTARPYKSEPPIVPENWSEEMERGIKFGAANGPLKIVEFMDLECPFCATWNVQLDSLLMEYPNVVQVTMHHLPLEGHRFAMPAAIATECADRQGAAQAFVRTTLANQAVLGLTSWDGLAHESGVADVGAFISCIALPADSFPRIAYGQALALATNTRGTPSLWVNGVATRPGLEQLRSLATGFEESLGR